VQTRVEPLSLARAVTDVAHQMDSELPVSEVGTMQRWVDESLSRTKFQTALLAGGSLVSTRIFFRSWLNARLLARYSSKPAA
jgi:hypothetical protein